MNSTNHSETPRGSAVGHPPLLADRKSWRRKVLRAKQESRFGRLLGCTFLVPSDPAILNRCRTDSYAISYAIAIIQLISVKKPSPIFRKSPWNQSSKTSILVITERFVSNVITERFVHNVKEWKGVWKSGYSSPRKVSHRCRHSQSAYELRFRRTYASRA